MSAKIVEETFGDDSSNGSTFAGLDGSPDRCNEMWFADGEIHHSPVSVSSTAAHETSVFSRISPFTPLNYTARSITQRSLVSPIFKKPLDISVVQGSVVPRCKKRLSDHLPQNEPAKKMCSDNQLPDQEESLFTETEMLYQCIVEPEVDLKASTTTSLERDAGCSQNVVTTSPSNNVDIAQKDSVIAYVAENDVKTSERDNNSQIDTIVQSLKLPDNSLQMENDLSLPVIISEDSDGAGKSLMLAPISDIFPECSPSTPDMFACCTPPKEIFKGSENLPEEDVRNDKIANRSIHSPLRGDLKAKIAVEGVFKTPSKTTTSESLCSQDSFCSPEIATDKKAVVLHEGSPDIRCKLDNLYSTICEKSVTAESSNIDLLTVLLEVPTKNSGRRTLMSQEKESVANCLIAANSSDSRSVIRDCGKTKHPQDSSNKRNRVEGFTQFPDCTQWPDTQDVKCPNLKSSSAISTKLQIDKVDASENDQQLNVGFMTAAGRKVSVSSEALQAVKSILEDFAVSSPTPVEANCVRKENNLSEKSLLQAECEERIDNNTASALPISFGFCTAAGQAVKVCPSAFAAAKKLLGDEMIDHQVPEMETKSNGSDNIRIVSEKPSSKTSKSKSVMNNFDSVIVPRRDDHHEVDDKSNDFLSINDPSNTITSFATTSSFGFATAGGKKIGVSAKAVEAAKRLLHGDDVSTCTGAETAVKIQQQQQQKAAVFVDEISASKRFQCMGFATAAGNSVSVSNDAIKAAKKLFEADQSTSSYKEKIDLDGKNSAGEQNLLLSSTSCNNDKTDVFNTTFQVTKTSTPVSSKNLLHSGAGADASRPKMISTTTSRENIKRNVSYVSEVKLETPVSRVKSVHKKDELATPHSGNNNCAAKKIELSLDDSFPCDIDEKTLIQQCEQQAQLGWQQRHRTSTPLVRPGANIESPNLTVVAGQKSGGKMTGFVTPFRASQRQAQETPKNRRSYGTNSKLMGRKALLLTSTEAVVTPERTVQPATRDKVLPGRLWQLRRGISENNDVLKRISLRELKDIESSPNCCYTAQELITLGVDLTTLEVTANNATDHFVLQSLNIHDDFYSLAGVERRLVSNKWIDNHIRWIVWKLAAMERTFPKCFAGRLLNREHVLDQLKYRYDVEIDHAQRSVLRRIVERDLPPNRCMVLCVAALFMKEPKPYIELTDGWYGVKCCVDSGLESVIGRGRLRVGDKVMVSGAQWMNSTDDSAACGPLEQPEDLRLVVCMNGVRRCKWYTPLGAFGGAQSFHVSLSSLYPQGGMVSCIRAVIVEAGPLQFLERRSDGGGILRTAEEEQKEQTQFEKARASLMERVAHSVMAQVEREDNMEQNCAYKEKGRSSLSSTNVQEISRLCSGSEISRLLDTSLDPSFVRLHLSAQQLSMLESYEMERRVKRQDEINQRIRYQCEKEPAFQALRDRKVVPLQRLLIKGLHSKDVEKNLVYSLTVWRPTSEMREMLSRVGCTFFVRNLSVGRPRRRGGAFEGQVELSTSKNTLFQPVEMPSSFTKSILTPRDLRVQRSVMERERRSAATMATPVALVGVIFETGLCSGADVLYLADISVSLVVKVVVSSGLPSYNVQVKPGDCVCVSNVNILPFQQRSRLPTGFEICTMHSTSQVYTLHSGKKLPPIVAVALRNMQKAVSVEKDVIVNKSKRALRLFTASTDTAGEGRLPPDLDHSRKKIVPGSPADVLSHQIQSKIALLERCGALLPSLNDVPPLSSTALTSPALQQPYRKPRISPEGNDHKNVQK